MSIFLKKEIEYNGQLGLWKIDEQEQFFKSALPISHYEDEVLKHKHQKRRLEWLAGRYLVFEMSEGKSCKVDKYGKPFLKDSPFNVSISHSGDYAAVVLNKKIVGIDIQKITPKIRRIAHKFLREEEKQSLDTENPLEHLHVYWGAKEALYKAYGKKGLDFREHIAVDPFQYQPSGNLSKGIVSKNNYHSNFLISYQKFQDYILVYAIEE